MAHMNKATRRRLFPVLAKRDDERCNVCKEEGTERSLIIDHIDNDDSNNVLTNLQLLCRRHNYLKNPRRKKGDHSHKSVSVCVRKHDQTISAELEKNRSTEPTFRHWLYWAVKTGGAISFGEAVDAGAEVAMCSQESIKRYIRKVCSTAGMYGLVNGEIVFKPKFAHHSSNGRYSHETNTSTKG